MISVIEVSYEMSEGGYIADSSGQYNPNQKITCSYAFPSINQEAWQLTDKPEVIRLKPIGHSVRDIKRLSYKYYPKGHGNSQEAKGENKFGIFS